MDKNQSEFREGRSTANATQMILRIDEEVRCVYGENETEGGPGAVLLDITKAYPRANRPVLWTMLENLGMPEHVLRIIKNLHEGTFYRVKGREGLSDKWYPKRGLREGCATSPILFNLYHAEAMRLASAERKRLAEEEGRECGLKWCWISGNHLPTLDPGRTAQSSASETFMITDSLFADDSTLIGWKSELKRGKEVSKAQMLMFEEKCHDGKEEMLTFANKGSEDIRMLGTRVGKKRDLAARIKRGYVAWAKVKKWLWKSKLSKRTQAVIVQAVVESTMLFDSIVRAWTKTDCQKLQTVADRAYRFIWNDGRGKTLLRMEKERTNMFEIRRQLGIDSVQQKIEVRALERLGHVIRMPDTRLTKKIILGRWNEPRKSQKVVRDSMVAYWRRLLAEAGEDWTNIPNLSESRKKWKGMVMRRKGEICEWEREMCSVHRGDVKPWRNHIIEVNKKKNFVCRWKDCGMVCKSKSGLVHHEKIHQRSTKTFDCKNCERIFKTKSSLTNHERACGKSNVKIVNKLPKEPCSVCGAPICKANMSRHVRSMHE